MIDNLGRILFYSILILPFSLVLGQAVVSINVLFICLIYIVIFFLSKIKIDFYFVIIIFFLFYFLSNLSAIFSDYTFYSLQHALLFIRFLIVSLSIYYVLTFVPNTLRPIFFIYFFICLFIILDSFFQYIFGFNILLEEYIRGETTRLSGIFGEENILGSYLHKLYPILLSLYIINFKENSKLKILILLTIFILNFIVILMSGERTALVLFILTNIMIIIFLKQNHIFKINIFVILIILPILILSFNQKIKYRLIDYTFSQISIKPPYILDDVYKDLFSTSLEIYSDNKIIGSGPNTFRNICGDQKYVKKHSCSTSPHNFYLQVLTETGFLGLICILMIYIYFASTLLLSLFRHFSNTNTYNAFILVNISIIINYFPFAQTGSFFSNWLMTISILPFGFYFYYRSVLEKQ